MGQGELTATLMRLSDLGVVKIERVKAVGEGARGVRNAADYRIARTGVEPSNPVDARTVELFFDKLGPLASDEDSAATCDSILLSDLNRAARRHKGTYANHVAEWKKPVSQMAHSRRFFTDRKRSNRGKLENCLVASVVVSSLSFGALGGAPGRDALIQFIVSGVTLGTSIALLIQTSMRMPKPSNNAIEIKAKMEAPRRWLLDFTNLDEAILQDVAPWNRLLVMAVVLGVSKQVMEKLGFAVPDILDDPDFSPTYIWCGAGSGTSALATSMGAGLSMAFSTTSSSSGSGDGFSGGDGGGGGGAFWRGFQTLLT